MANEAQAEFSAESPILTIRDKNVRNGVAGLDANKQIDSTVLPDEVNFAVINALKNTFETTECL